MPLRNSRPVTFRAKGLTDAVDATNAFPGAMSSLQNLIPDPRTLGIFVPRPAIVSLVGAGTNPTQWGSFTWGQASWGGFDSIADAAQPNALLCVGNVVYGMIASTGGTYAGCDVPFAYNVETNTFYTIAIPGGAASLPTTPPASGDWSPPQMAVVGTRVMLTHPGFAGGSSPYFGWLDISSFSDNTHTGNTNSNTTINSLSANVLQAGWQVGMTITDSAGDIPANTTITAIASGGLSLTISQAATGSNSGTTFTVAGGTPTAPLYASGNTNLHALAAVPVAVAQFNGRAYFAVQNGVALSDAGVPCQLTVATQVLTFSNGLAVTALAGLPYTQTTGGILQALMAFQGDNTMQQISGDPSFTNNPLSVNSLGVGAGTLAPNTLAVTPMGLTFISGDGMRVINFLGVLSDPIGANGQGIQQAFLNAIAPSRMCAAYNQDVYRVTVQNGAVSGSPFQEYWFHVSRKVWTGPHTSTASQIVGYQGPTNYGFILANAAGNAELWTSQVTPTTISSYIENGNPMPFIWQPSLMPDNQEMAENCIVESLFGLALPPGSQGTLGVFNEAGVQLDQLTIMGPTANPTGWGSFNWGQAPWGAPLGFFAQYDLPWHLPLVFKQMYLTLNGYLTAGMMFGNLYYRYQTLGYRLQAMATVSGGAR